MMKTLLLAVMMVTVAASAASAADGNIHLGVLGGINLSSATFSPEQGFDLSARNRANLGAFAEFAVTRNLFLEARGMYVQKGVKGTSSEERFTANISMNYLTFPLLLKVKANQASWKPYLVIGGELGFKTSAGANLFNNGRVEEDEDFNDGVKSTDFALDFGGGIEVPGKRVSFIIEGIYSLGLMNLVEVPDADVVSAKTRTFLVNLGVRF
jgi:opacity protein-like surface antigen